MEVLGLSCLFGLLIMFQNCDGFCFAGKLMAEQTVSQRPRYFCEYKPIDGPILRLFPGSNLYLVDQCLDCKCTMDGLECCGIGHASGTIAYKKDCKMLLDGCQPFVVKKDNQSLDCFTGKPINFTALSEQTVHPDNMYISGNLRNQVQSPSASVAKTTAETSSSPVTATAQRASSTKTASTATPAHTTTDHTSPSPTTTVPTSTAPITAISQTTTAEATTAALIPTIETTSTAPAGRLVGQDNVPVPSFAEYLRHLISSRNAASNFVAQPHFAPYWNTGNNLHTAPFLPAQPQRQSNNFWHHDYFMPWFLFL